ARMAVVAHRSLIGRARGVVGNVKSITLSLVTARRRAQRPPPRSGCKCRKRARSRSVWSTRCAPEDVNTSGRRRRALGGAMLPREPPPLRLLLPRGALRGRRDVGGGGAAIRRVGICGSCAGAGLDGRTAIHSSSDEDEDELAAKDDDDDD